MIKYNKDDLAKTMADNFDISKGQAEEEVNRVLEGLILQMSKGKDEEPNSKGVRARFTAVGFGSLELKAVPERTHRNPQDPSVTHTKPEHNTIKIKSGKVFDDHIN